MEKNSNGMRLSAGSHNHTTVSSQNREACQVNSLHRWYHHCDPSASSTFTPNKRLPVAATMAMTRMVSANACTTREQG
eukprot:1161353-Pelagomonas_calceolata.AAC.10